MRLNAILLLSTAAASISLLLIPLQAIELGASNMMVGAIVAVYGLMSLVSFYLFGWVSDTRGRVFLIKFGMVFSAATFLLQILAESSVSLFMARALCGFSIGIFYSSLVMCGIESKKQLGKYMSFESLGFGVGTLLAGIIGVYGRIFTLSSVFFFVSFLMALKLPKTMSKKIRTPLLPHGIVMKNITVYLPFLMRDVGAYTIWSLFPIYLSGLGANSFWIGLLFFLNTGSQFLFKQFVDRIAYRKLFMGGLLVSAIAFSSYAFPSNYLQVIPIQILIAISWSLLQVGAIGLLTTSNAEKATVVGLFSSARSLAQVIGPMLAGVISQYYGFQTLMIFSGGLTFAALAIRWVVERRES